LQLPTISSGDCLLLLLVLLVDFFSLVSFAVVRAGV
jgi:hypothetical protein